MCKRLEIIAESAQPSGSPHPSAKKSRRVNDTSTHALT